MREVFLLSKVERKQRLEGLSEKIFLDRYAWKDADSNNAKVGDVVLVLTKDDPKFPTKEVGEIVERSGRIVTVKTRSGELVKSDVEKLTLNIEKTPEEMWDRLSTAMASVEKTPELQAEWAGKFRSILDDWKLVPGGRIAAGAGASEELTLFNCYVIPSPKDSRGGIMQTLSEMTEIMARGGGVGINLSSLRPRRAIVRGVNGSSSGSVSWGGLFSYTTGLIEQGGSRRGALMLMINDWHPDVEDFITVKQTMGQVTNANLSVCVSNGFMKAVKEDLDWDLVFPDTTDPEYNEMWDGDLDKWKAAGKNVIHYRTVKARDVWRTIIESAWKSAEPGVVFMEYYNQMSNSWYFNPIICTNPCGEQGLPGWGVCNLSAVNLSKFYDEKNHDVDWEDLATTTRYSVRFLDNVIDKTPYHFPENEANQKKERRVGLGTMGLAELMIKLNIRYGSPESLEFLDKLYGFMAREAYLASAEIAGEKGSFLAFDTEKYLMSGFMKNIVEAYPEVGEAIREHGMRNVTVITQAPTGSTGTMVGTSTGIEPYFAFKYFRQSRLGYDEQFVPIAQEWLEAHPGEELPDYFVTSMDLSAKDHIRAQAAIQRWVDSSISKTANCPSDFTVEETAELYEMAFDLGCKGVTIYRDGSRDVQVLETTKKEDKKEAAPVAAEEATTTVEASTSVVAASPAPQVTTKEADKQYKKRPQVLRGATYKINTPFGMAYITINDLDGIPAEIFLNVGKAGSDVFAMAEALGRVCSLFLRYGDHGEKVELLIKHLKGIGGSGAIGFGANRVESIADAVAKALESHVLNNAHDDHVPAPIAATLELEDFNEALNAEIKSSVPSATEDGHGGHHGHNHSTASRDLCPSCGSASLINIEGCKTCGNCGYSRCG
ncbi:adenosylcobalamin-dependent ribonucleoside-diphosphate reductase [Paenibacillus odorifer]|uniref:adenosylcobalamin-dependent ribonucleoside-diphosphate reductase n=1 Tax=unclassified Paenibacillus TaxID=185978 RepID=UPI00096C7FA2|nr:adenosylcobalamin-dependent ribonucleoside-diphosphate reductase [Paenibacillus odorifer]MEC0130879.1 adenosylcobalamin-dependent ribonucleoside-diphosphate reductase [Paenibacillus odorifer]MEC0221083.1 adenosylcobalamin-dependent ribonucleoside-diphosphate reductase [Paenibacillus odorifer]OMD15516.1 ribonucleoside-diphosphate reductase, adenosylcobalamin-dependent [Paenibacillus odorifer]OZQ74533.1 ribonucleoside-diphosphate reductase, adenosylcobalamin-dependent [Paenibacillus odorifer]